MVVKYSRRVKVAHRASHPFIVFGFIPGRSTVRFFFGNLRLNKHFIMDIPDFIHAFTDFLQIIKSSPNNHKMLNQTIVINHSKDWDIQQPSVRLYNAFGSMYPSMSQCILFQNRVIHE